MQKCRTACVVSLNQDGEECSMEEFKYARIGTTLYKFVDRPTANGDTIRVMIPWSYTALAADEGKRFAATIPKFDGFCTVPMHVNYTRCVKSFYNLYEPITHEPQAGDFPHIKMLVEHIFEEHFELGMDYLQLLYTNPVQKLPILLLVSEERNTGKTTFLNFLKAVFQKNVTFNTNEDFRSKFNADWAGKLLIGVDEVLLDKREDSERLKNLSTAKLYKIEAKGKDRQEVEFIAKFVLCSNNESFPVIIDPGETRYWVRKIHHLDLDDPNFLQKLEDEIPAFLFYLNRRDLATKKESRMWFDPALIHTATLDKIISASRNRTEIDMAEVLMDIMVAEGVGTIKFCKTDIRIWMEFLNYKPDMAQIRRVLHDIWKVPHAGNADSYDTYCIDCSRASRFGPVKAKGRYYTVTKDDIKHLIC